MIDINEILNNWANIYEQADSRYKNIASTDDLTALSVAQLKELISFSGQFVQTQDHLFCDFRHILGMYSIDAKNTSKLVSLFKKIEKYRTIAKRISNIDSLNFDISFSPSTYDLKCSSGTLVASTTDHATKSLISPLTIEHINNHTISVTIPKNNLKENLTTFLHTVFPNVKSDVAENRDKKLGNESTKNRLDSGVFQGFPVTEAEDYYRILVNKDMGTPYKYLSVLG